jgi:RNA polymerase sigma factor (TIGR02999 family)
MLGGDTAAPADVPWRDRRQFYRAAAEAMRRILIEHARRRGAEKRGGNMKRTLLNVCELAADHNSGEILAIDEAILRLDELDPSAAEIVRLRFFAGLSVEQTAAALEVSERSVRREWTYARAKLFRLLKESPGP